MSHHAIKQKVLQCDEELSEQALSQLLKFLPGPEEVRNIIDVFMFIILCNLCVDCKAARFTRTLY